MPDLRQSSPPSQLPTAYFQESPGRTGWPTSPAHSQTRSQRSLGRGLAMLPAEGSQQAPHKPLTCLFISWIQGHIHPQKENLYACVGLNQTQVNISPTTASHYNTEAWYFTPAVIIWWEAGNRRDSNKGLYPHSRGHQNWLQADSGRELQKHFQTNLKHLGCKMGDA